MAKDLLESLKLALHDFTTQPLRQAVLGLFGVLGLKSPRVIGIDSLEALIEAAPLESRGKLEGLRGTVSKLHALFQITTEEIRGMTSQTSLFGSGEWDRARVESYITVALELSKPDLPRSELAKITRSLNQALGTMPALVLMKHGHSITLSVVQRRLNKRDAGRDVLEKITLIRGVDCLKPHRAHLEILSDFALPQLTRDHTVTNFVQLERAWAEVLNAEKLNRTFYKDLANWYFWACQHPGVKLPKDAKGKEDFFIRLITRLMFVWFLLEKDLIPGEVFNAEKLKAILKAFDPASSTDSNYYQAILQNLFFATLNTEMGAERQFKSDKRKQGSSEYGAQTLYRYDELFVKPEAALELFKDVPFLNGGLFENLDKTTAESPSGKDYRVDGFSSDEPKRARVPNELFFGAERPVDLNSVYDTKNKRYKAKGLLEIFESYKFTVAENTPVEEEVALDPELLGQVFENLLASYNEETRSTARKQTGSFYTPRNIVDYMVDESLIAYLHEALSKPTDTASASPTPHPHKAPHPSPLPQGERELEVRLRQLFSYTQEPHQFSPSEVNELVAAIDQLKLLDPACGSGAFPMGALQKLVYVLGKLDPNNARWKKQQIEREIEGEITRIRDDLGIAKRISDAEARKLAEDKLQERLEQIEQAFKAERTDLDYARKLFLLENCIYGVDIQPIAVQIAKLRCFIALIVDQRTPPNLPNRGVLPLPNLETKFVAADSLGKIKQSPAQELFGGELEKLKEELRAGRHKHFQARKYSDKKKWRDEDKRIRAHIAKLLEKDHLIDADTAKKLADWNPYDQNASASFFDPEWMFGALGGFDVAIGNPPYVRQEEIKHLKPTFRETYKDVFVGTADLFVYFFKRSIEVLKPGGTLAFICSNKYFRSGYGENLRKVLGNQTRIGSLIDFGDANVFTAIAYPSILITQNAKPDHNQMRALVWNQDDALEDFVQIFDTQHFTMPQSALKPDGWRIERKDVLDLLDKLHTIGTPLRKYVGEVYRGIVTGLNDAFVIDEDEKKELINKDNNSSKIIKPFLRGRDIARWVVKPQNLFLIFTRQGTDINNYPAVKAHLEQFRPQLEARLNVVRDGDEWFQIPYAITYWQEFEKPKILYQEIATHQAFAWDETNSFINNKAFLIPSSTKFLLAILNSKVFHFLLDNTVQKLAGDAFAMQSIYLEKLPIAKPSPALETLLTQLVDYILLLSTQPSSAQTQAVVRYLEQIIDALVYELYLPEVLHAAGRHPLQTVGAVQFPALSGDAARDLRAINEVYETLFDPQHEVRKLVFYLDSIPEVRIIEGKDKG